MRLLITAILAIALSIAASLSTAQEPPRLALLIGNKGYTAKVGPLKNPHKDVELIEASLKRLGFRVTVLKDATYKQMDTALKRYVADVRRAGKGALSFFYYSGHGVANPENQVNYLIPVDVADADDDKVWFESFQQNVIIDVLSRQSPGATHYLVFDACRNELNVAGANAKALGAEKGFAPIADTAGLLIAYATAPKRAASDAGEGGGPYAKVLAEELVKPGVESVTMFRNVQIRVKQSIGQDPWLSFPSLPPVYLAGRSAEPPATARPAAPAVPSSAAETVRVCREVETLTSLSMLAVLEGQYAGMPAADCISARIGELKAAQAVAAKAADDQAKADTAARRRIEIDAGAKAEAERQRLAMLDQERQDEARKAAEAEARRKRAEAAGAMTPGRIFRDCSDCPEMVVVPAGEFMMGSLDGGSERASEGGSQERPQRKVTIREPFAVGKFEVTFAEWDACVSSGGCKHKPETDWERGRQPVMRVSWHDTQEYVAWLSKKAGEAYRLLTEAEWEYAARAGTATPFSTGDTITTEQANSSGSPPYPYNSSAKVTSRGKTVDVGTFKPNAFGLHDMHGNVWEWVQDCFNLSYTRAPTDGRPVPDTPGCARVLRGGSWNINPYHLRSAARWRATPDSRESTYGFRLARTLNP